MGEVVGVRGRSLVAASSVAVVGVLLAGCGDGGPSEDCTPMTDEQLSAVAEGLKVEAEVTRGSLFPIPVEDQELGYTDLAAVEVTDAESTEVTTLATSDAGNLLDLDHMSRVYFTWGEATTDDSPAGIWRDSMVGSDTDQEAKACLS